MNNIVLLGHGVGVRLIIEALKVHNELNYEVAAVVTHPYEDHQRDLDLISKRKELYGKYAYNVFNVERDFNLPLLEANDVNAPQVIEWISTFNPAFLISIGCRNIIRASFLERFPNKVLNIHTVPLPKYRGAAGDSWMILNDEWGKQLFGCLHYIDKGIDTGDIIAKSYYTLPDKTYPIDVFKTRMNIFEELIIKGLRNLAMPGFIPEKQVQDEATVFPRLFTPVDGKIEWDKYSGSEIERFIYAFSYPFEGAHCLYKDKKINIVEATFFKNQAFHPFANGLIFGRNPEYQYKVAVDGGYLLLKRVEVDGIKIDQRKIFRLGKRLK